MSRRKIAEIAGINGIARVYRDSQWNEYAVRCAGAGYHTSDKGDAFATARRMAGPAAVPSPVTAGSRGTRLTVYRGPNPDAPVTVNIYTAPSGPAAAVADLTREEARALAAGLLAFADAPSRDSFAATCAHPWRKADGACGECGTRAES